MGSQGEVNIRAQMDMHIDRTKEYNVARYSWLFVSQQVSALRR